MTGGQWLDAKYQRSNWTSYRVCRAICCEQQTLFADYKIFVQIHTCHGNQPLCSWLWTNGEIPLLFSLLSTALALRLKCRSEATLGISLMSTTRFTISTAVCISNVVSRYKYKQVTVCMQIPPDKDADSGVLPSEWITFDLVISEIWIFSNYTFSRFRCKVSNILVVMAESFIYFWKSTWIHNAKTSLRTSSVIWLIVAVHWPTRVGLLSLGTLNPLGSLRAVVLSHSPHSQWISFLLHGWVSNFPILFWILWINLIFGDWTCG